MCTDGMLDGKLQTVRNTEANKQNSWVSLNLYKNMSLTYSAGVRLQVIEIKIKTASSAGSE